MSTPSTGEAIAAIAIPAVVSLLADLIRQGMMDRTALDKVVERNPELAGPLSEYPELRWSVAKERLEERLAKGKR